ncbi:MAG: T9SS type A sorting domain-containing protein [Ignavibacteria bacterium]|nr:T9SS type A sorting domain-containing protein [Ignavibacteria bacterium]
MDEEQSAGIYQVTFNTQQTTNNKQLSSGIYFYQLRAGDFVQTKKMILLR